MKKLFWMTAAVVLLVGCSKDDENSHVDEPTPPQNGKTVVVYFSNLNISYST